jgi:hypothetical protein
MWLVDKFLGRDDQQPTSAAPGDASTNSQPGSGREIPIEEIVYSNPFIPDWLRPQPGDPDAERRIAEYYQQRQQLESEG